MLRLTAIIYAIFFTLFTPGVIADEWVKGLFTHKEHAADLNKPVIVDSFKKKYTLVEGEKVQQSNKIKTTYIANKDLLRKNTIDTRKISKGNFCNLNSEIPHLSGYNTTDIIYVTPCEEKRLPKYKLR